MHQRTARLSIHLIMLALWLVTLVAQAAGATGLPGTAAGRAGIAQQADGRLVIPFSQTAPKVDGNCGEYTDAVAKPFDDGGGKTGTVFLKHNSNLLFVCMRANPGTFEGRFGSLYLDPQADGSSYDFAQKDDYALRVNIPGTTKSSFNGTGVANGYVANAAIVSFWDGASTTNQEVETVEWQVSLGRFFLGDCGKLFGIAAYHHWFSAMSDDYGWPSNQFFDQPRTWQFAQLADGPCTTPQRGRIAYIYRGNTADAASFYNLLTGAGYTVDLIPLGSVLTTVFRAPAGAANYDLIIVADDTGDLDRWGSTAPPPDISPDQVNRIRDARIPIIGLGEGGYAFFGKLSLFIGWPNGWHGPEDRVNKPTVPPPPPAYYTGLADASVIVYTEPVNTVGIYLNDTPPNVAVVGLENPTTDHASIIQEGCRLLWGFSGNPNVMEPDGKTLFLNAVAYMSVFQCGQEPQPPPECIVTKTSDPASGTTVEPGDVIRYTITYTNCEQVEVKLVDTIPAHTDYVPGSATAGATLTVDGSLIWVIPPGGSGSVSFKVLVSEAQCNNQRTVSNRAGLLIPGKLPVPSNVVTHKVECPPIRLPNDDPMFAESEIAIHPYPLIAGKPSTISVKISNATSESRAIVVEFQTSPNRFGIGLNFNTFDTRNATIPGNGNVIVQGIFTPASSGHYCIQIKITILPRNANEQPIVITTQRNLDVTETLVAGQPDTLTFKVGNPTGAAANITLVVDNTCPGFTAVVAPPLLTNVGPNSTDIRDATLTVTPPDPVVLGSGCHIDVIGWIGDQMIGGIRKLDVPPVHLPPNVDPPWLEPEISVIPDPLVLGQPRQICVELQNPLGVARTVTLDYAVADFGAGIPFTTVATRTATLPPNSNAKYCVNWTPTPSNNLHRCILVTLKQAGYRDLRSQRNIDIVRARPQVLEQLNIPFKVGNPDLVRHNLVISPTIFGLDPFWVPQIVTDEGDSPPDVIEPGQILDLRLRFAPRVALAAANAPQEYRFGDVSRVDVGVLLDGEAIGGFTVELETARLYMPLVLR